MHKLQDSYDLILLILHRDDEHGLGSVAELLVKVAVQPEGQVADAISILDVQNFSGCRGITCDAAGIDGQGKLAEGDRVAVALGELEDQVLPPARLILDEVKRPSVTTSDFAALRQDQLE